MRSWTLVTVLAVLAGVADASDATKLRRMMSDSRFMTMVSPCTVGGAKRNSPSEWVRNAFHDAADYDAAKGTGGIDGSIYYETGYDANRGTTFTTTMTEFKFYQQDDVTLADMVALGATLALGSCEGPQLPYYHGRIDATRGSGEGFVPEPEQSTETHLEMFARMGFTPTEMISLIACGHTLGGVHGADNPTLTSDVYHHFDTTHAHFDNKVATEFMNDTRQNPLANEWDPDYPARSSDTRIFAVDGNATIKSYAEDGNKFFTDCERVFAKMLNEAVPAGVTLQGPLVPFPVSGTLWPTTRNGALTISTNTATARLHDMVGQWSSFEIGYTNRDGSEGTDGVIIQQDVKTTSNGKTIEFRPFGTATGGSVPPATGLGSININVKLNDGTMYTSAEGEEIIKYDDTILMDVGNQFTCKYTGEANNNLNGMNFSAHVLGPYQAGDKVEIILRSETMQYTTLAANYVSPLNAYYNTYNVFIADRDAIDFNGFGAKLTRADGSVHRDTKDDVYYRLNTASKCVDGATVPSPAPVPSGSLQRRRAAAKKRERAMPCPTGYAFCGGRCVDFMTDLEHCGACAGAGGVDCTTLSDDSISCVAGKCVRG